MTKEEIIALCKVAELNYESKYYDEGLVSLYIDGYFHHVPKSREEEGWNALWEHRLRHLEDRGNAYIFNPDTVRHI